MASINVELLPRLGCANVVVTGILGRISARIICNINLMHYMGSSKNLQMYFSSDLSPKSVSVRASEVEVPQIIETVTIVEPGLQ